MGRILPILFNTDMVRAILDDRKTVTRRAVRFKYDNTEMRMRTDKYGTCLIEIQKDIEGETHGKNPDGSTWHKLLPYIEKNPPYKKGDILYVRETWQCWRAHRYEATADIMFRAGGKGVRIKFKNGSTDSIDREDYDSFVRKWYSYHGKWRPSIHMPKEAARIWLRVTDVRAEQLQDITNEQILEEGISKETVLRYMKQCPEETEEWERASHIIPYSELWDSTIKKSDIGRYDWGSNSWVWVIEFERCEKPEDN